MWAKDSANRVYRFDQDVGYYAMPEVIDKLFALHVKWKGYTTATLLEANAMQKGIYDLVVEDQLKRGIYMNIRKCNAAGNKIVRIRTTVGSYLHKSLVYLTDAASLEFNEERLAFPSPRLDVLDESEKAMAYLETPEGPESRAIHEAAKEEAAIAAMDITDEGEYADVGFGYN